MSVGDPISGKISISGMARFQMVIQDVLAMFLCHDVRSLQRHNTSRVISKMLPEISMEPMRFARFEAKKVK